MLVQNKKKFMFGRAAKYQLFAGKRCLAFFLSIMLLMSIFQAVPVKAAGIKLYYFDTKKTVTYTGTKASYEYNGSKVSLGTLQVSLLITVWNSDHTMNFLCGDWGFRIRRIRQRTH